MSLPIAVVRGISSVVLGVSVCLGLSGRAAADTPAATRADPRINELLEPIRKKHNLPALAGAIVRSKGLLAVGAVGVRKHGSDVAVTVDDCFHLGSDTKAMTAVVIGRLVEKGKLSWELALEKAFPDLAESMPAALRKVTLTQLLSHHSGLAGSFKEPGGWWQLSRKGTIREQRISAMQRALSENPDGKPGDKFVYSNVNYVIAAALAEKATGATWEDLITRELFTPLGMKTAGFGAAGKAGKIDQPWPHHKNGDPVAPGLFADNPPVMGPAGRVHCSLPDWSRFVADQLRGARGQRGLLRAATYKRLHASPYRDHFYTVGGWTGAEVKGRLILQHDGCNTMNYASALLVPARDVAILVCTNQGTAGGPGQKGCQEAMTALQKEFAGRWGKK